MCTLWTNTNGHGRQRFGDYERATHNDGDDGGQCGEHDLGYGALVAMNADHPSTHANQRMVQLPPADGVAMTYTGEAADSDVETARFASVTLYPGGGLNGIDDAGEALVLPREHIQTAPCSRSTGGRPMKDGLNFASAGATGVAYGFNTDDAQNGTAVS